MADTPKPISPSDIPAETSNAWSNFLDTASNTTKPDKTIKSEDILYNDFFQENSNGDLTIGNKKQWSGLEVFVRVMQYVTIFVVVTVVLSWIHIFVRSSQSGSFFESYTFLCPYLNYDINVPTSEKWCKNIEVIQKEYSEKQKILQESIVEALTEYIPIKVSSSILDASPEKAFIINTYDNKPHVNIVLEAFEKVKANSQSVKGENINCTGLTVTEWINLSTQCTVYGGSVGSNDTNGQVGSARVQALRFIENLADTNKSSLILDTQPTSLGIEIIPLKEAQILGFSTRTFIPIQVRYVPLIQKI